MKQEELDKICGHLDLIVDKTCEKHWDNGNPQMKIIYDDLRVLRSLLSESQIQYSVDVPEQYTWFLKEVLELTETFVKKNQDYSGGRPDQWLDNFKGGGLRGIFNRMDDKFNRLKTFLKTGKLENESFEDSCKDLSVYCLILMRAMQEKVSLQGEYWDEK